MERTGQYSCPQTIASPTFRVLSNLDTLVHKLTRYDSFFENQFSDSRFTLDSIRDMALIDLLAYHTHIAVDHKSDLLNRRGCG
jgi:hypothetical protein